MCECISKYNKFLKEKYGETAIANYSLFGDGTCRFNVTGLYRKVTNSGRYKNVEVNLYPKYCPFCGQPYNLKEVEEKEDV